jgi:tripartite-type tricarboxylate transporter receptor subunit TctC
MTSRTAAVLIHALVATVLSAATGVAFAAVAGGKPITLVVSYAPGGGADLMARLIAPKMSEALGQTVIVENKPGGAGQIAGAYVAKAAPDGATLLVDASSFAVVPSLYPKMPYDAAKAFTPIAVLALFPNVLVANPAFAAKNARDVVSMAKAKPGSVAYASSGNGSAQHLAGALFEQVSKTEMMHVPYKGGGPAMLDVMGGQVPLFFANLASASGHIKNGKLRPIAVTSGKRSAALSDVPTMAESGIAGYEVYEWNPVLAPAGISDDTKKQLVAAIAKAMAAPDVRERIAALGGESFAGGPSEAAKFLDEQRQLWSKVVQERGIKPE